MEEASVLSEDEGSSLKEPQSIFSTSFKQKSPWVLTSCHWQNQISSLAKATGLIFNKRNVSKMNESKKEQPIPSIS